jgi:hypothetical protein
MVECPAGQLAGFFMRGTLTLRNLFELTFWGAGVAYFLPRQYELPEEAAIQLLVLLVWVGGGIGRLWNRVGLGAAMGLAAGSAAALSVFSV